MKSVYCFRQLEDKALDPGRDSFNNAKGEVRPQLACKMS